MGELRYLRLERHDGRQFMIHGNLPPQPSFDQIKPWAPFDVAMWLFGVAVAGGLGFLFGLVAAG